MNFSIDSFNADLETIDTKGTGTQTLPVATQVPTGTGHHHNLASFPKGSLLDMGVGAMFLASLVLLGFAMVLC